MKKISRQQRMLVALLLRTHLLMTLLGISFCCVQAAELETGSLTFCCSATNDLYCALAKGGTQYPRFDQAADAFEHAQPNSAVLILADHYPNETTRLEPDEWTLAQSKQLQLYIEFPGPMPGLEVATPRDTAWERGIVSSDAFGSALPKLRILAIHDCHFTPLTATNTWIMVGRVAGFDTAVYGLPKDAFPILADFPEKKLLVATTKLSGFVTGRYAPYRDWETIWQTILAKLDPKANAHKLAWEPTVAPAFGPNEKLPRRFEKQAFEAFANWIPKSRLLVSSDRKAIVEKELAANHEMIEVPGPEAPIGDGSLGIQEGYASGIRYDGSQLQRLPLRADCNTESAMVLALDYSLNGTKASRNIAGNLLNYVYFNSDMCGGVRADPKSGAFGLIGWGAISPVWLVANYGDDNANAMLSTMAAAACLKKDRWDEMLLRGLLANLRTTGKSGFRGDRIDNPALEQQGWKAFHDSATINFSPHFESYLWACNLWAYHQTGFTPFLEKTRTAIAMTMLSYPDAWRLKDNVERAHMLLCLSWLVRVDDNPQHRVWLKQVAKDLLAHQSASGAIHEWLGGTGGGHYQIPQSNEAYGTGETPLIQQNGDPASDQLYTTGFALLGLHEAVGATGDKELKQAEDQLAEFLCRIQIRSQRIQYLNGAWFRAFDDKRWEFWSSSADAGWGAWSVEAGWGQSWIATTLALRQKKTTFWELTSSSKIKNKLQKVKADMAMRDEEF
jgi:hypothetical protein